MTIQSEAALRELLGTPSKGVANKKVPHLEEAAEIVIARSPCIGVAWGSDQPGCALLVGDAGFAAVEDADHLVLQRGVEGCVGRLPEKLEDGTPVATIVMIPGMTETLRVNGRAAGGDASRLRIRVDESLFHCPKAFIRSHLWDVASNRAEAETTAPSAMIGAVERRFLEQVPFALMATVGPDGADLSPRGDPPGFLRVLDEHELLLPDRPGNRLADGFRNLLVNPKLALLALVPGQREAMHIVGDATIETDPALLAESAIRDRAPKLATRIRVRELARVDSDALPRIWNPATRVDRKSLPSFGRLAVQQIDPDGRAKGFKSWVVDRMLQQDAKKNLY